MAYPMDSVADYHTPQKGQLTILPKLQNFQTHQSFEQSHAESHRLKPQTEETIAEEQAGFRAGRSSTEQIFNVRMMCEKYFQHQQNLYHVFTDFKKSFLQGMACSLMGRHAKVQYQCKSRKESPQKLTQLSSRSHPRHLVGKRIAQKTSP